jgi:hypothetical protein
MRDDHSTREDWEFAALLVIAAFANVVFGGRSLVPDDPHAMTFTQRYRGFLRHAADSSLSLFQLND